MKTTRVKEISIEKNWLTVDAKDKILGRLATDIAYFLRGKHKASFTPHLDCGDYVVVTNAAQIALSGKKAEDKLYHYHSGYIGGLKSQSAQELLAKQPEKLIIKAVKGMLPKNKLADKILKNLRVYAGESHKHSAQGPLPMPEKLKKNGEGK